MKLWFLLPGRAFFQHYSLEKKAKHLLKKAEQKDMALATAESCTGGMLSALLTDVEGLSHVFERGYVVYTNDAKAQCLDIEACCIRKNGAVSRQTAEAMAEGALKRSRAHLALAVTGYAGPGDESEEEGLVHIALARHDEPTLHREFHFGSIGRQRIRLATLEEALKLTGYSLENI